MKAYKPIIALAIIVGAVFIFVNKTAENGVTLSITPTDMKITSSAFEHNQKIPSKYTCDAENISPELSFSAIPENAMSLVLISHDPDAPRQGGWTHWVVINMNPTATGIAENSKSSSGLETTTDFGKAGYGGPCPPSGSHRYYFYLYALDTTLDLDATATKEVVETAMEGHILEKAELMGNYQRK
jgi:Raf kinase inhibitor-like YbhB/YbcL family protein